DVAVDGQRRLRLGAQPVGGGSHAPRLERGARRRGGDRAVRGRGTGRPAAAGMCGVALGSDGGGSIRYPSALTGLFGIKTQRDRISLGPDHHDAWNGLSVYGPLARTVADAALFLDATAQSVPDAGFATALEETQRPLRVAVSFKPPQGSLARL